VEAGIVSQHWLYRSGLAAEVYSNIRASVNELRFLIPLDSDSSWRSPVLVDVDTFDLPLRASPFVSSQLLILRELNNHCPS
jgi:hypothetical protein